MSAAWVPCNATVARWFSRRRGTAVAIASTGASLGNLVVPPLVALGVETWGWRPTLGVLALASAFLIGIAARAMVRDPETRGQWPDGDQRPPTAAMLAAGSTVAEAIHTTEFRGIVAVYFLTWLVVFVPFVHAPAYARDLGLSPLAAAALLSAIGVGGVIGRLLSGVVSDRYGRFPTLFAICVLQAVSFVQLIFASDAAMLWLAAAAFGLSYGGAVAVLPALCGDLFGRAHVASVVGVIFAIAGAPAAAGPYLAGWLFDASGSYAGAFSIAAALNALAAALTLWLMRRLRGMARR
jgi:MFS family permease